MYVYQSLLGNGSYLVNTSQLNPQLLNCLLKSLTNESRLNPYNSSPRWLRVFDWLDLNLSLSYVTTDGQSASPSWYLQPDIYYCQTVAGLLLWGAPFDERTYLSFTIAPGPRQRSHLRVRVPWDSWPNFTVSDSSPWLNLLSKVAYLAFWCPLLIPRILGNGLCNT
jgi:hypothetical protein